MGIDRRLLCWTMYAGNPCGTPGAALLQAIWLKGLSSPRRGEAEQAAKPPPTLPQKLKPLHEMDVRRKKGRGKGKGE